jgi:hypothetical protein
MTMMVDLYYCPKGATKAERVTTFKIDADDAIRAFPDDYSLTPPAGREIVDLTPALPSNLEAMQAPEEPDVRRARGKAKDAPTA